MMAKWAPLDENVSALERVAFSLQALAPALLELKSDLAAQLSDIGHKVDLVSAKLDMGASSQAGHRDCILAIDGKIGHIAEDLYEIRKVSSESVATRVADAVLNISDRAETISKFVIAGCGDVDGGGGDPEVFTEPCTVQQLGCPGVSPRG